MNTWILLRAMLVGEGGGLVQSSSTCDFTCVMVCLHRGKNTLPNMDYLIFFYLFPGMEAGFEFRGM